MNDFNLMDYIPKGEESAVSMHNLAQIVGTSCREIRKMVFNLRCKGEIIAGTDAGYYVPESDAELLSYYRKAKARGLSTLKSISAARRELIQRGIMCDGKGAGEHGER